MGDKVYLWELDSVRNSVEECRIARETLYRKLLLEGKTVVITCNQLSDGRWLAPILKDEENYKYLLKLFKLGTLVISQYKDIRTVSQYTQNALENALNKGKDFKFSGIAMEKEETYIMQEMYRAICYSNPEQLKADIVDLQHLRESEIDFSEDSELMIKIKANATDGNQLTFSEEVCKYYYLKGMMQTPEKFRVCLEYEIRRLLLVYHYVKLILLLSESKTIDNEPMKNSTKFSTILKYVLDSRQELISETDHIEWKDSFEKAVQEMQNIFSEDSSMQNRSIWYRKIDEQCKKQQISREVHDFQILMVDICYNFTLESSIKGIDCAFDDDDKQGFANEFVYRMNCYYKMYCEGIHKVGKFYKLDDDIEECWNWKQLAEIRKDVYKLENKRGRKKKRISWMHKVKKTQKSISTKVFAGAVLAVVGIDLGVNTLYDVIGNGDQNAIGLVWLSQMGTSDWLNVVQSWCNILGLSIIKVLVVGVIISLIQKRFGLHDILDEIVEWKQKLSNWRMFKTIAKQTGYVQEEMTEITDNHEENYDI